MTQKIKERQTSYKAERIKSLKPIPQFASEEEECEFWLSADTIKYFDSTPTEYEPPSKMPLSLKVDTRLLLVIKRFAQAQGIPYQQLINQWLWERAQEEIITQRKAKPQES